MACSIAEVARMSGVTSRTLRHYDEIGLLTPAWVGSNGYRYYEEKHLLRLQQILVLRELGLGLSEISQVLDQQTDEIEALRSHRNRLLAESARLCTLAETVGRTITSLLARKDGTAMSKINKLENLFEGFDGAKYDQEVRKRFPEQYEEAKDALDQLSPVDIQRMKVERTQQLIRLAEFMTAGKPADDPTVLSEIAMHYKTVSQFWTPDSADFKRIAKHYVEENQWRALLEKIAPGLAEYHRDAMIAYANEHLN